MKKIVAVVLALVMVLGLSTVAFADSTSTTVKKDGYLLLDIDTNEATPVAENFTKVVTDKMVVKEGDETTTYYFADMYLIGEDTYYACDASLADVKLVKNNKVVAYLTETELDEGVSAVATAFVEAPKAPSCGDYEDDTFVINGKNYAAGGTSYAVYKGLVVAVDMTAPAEAVEHDFEDATETFDSKGTVVAVECNECEKTFKVVAKVPADYTGAAETYGQAYVLLGTYVADAAADDADKVESAETFDAGIAMYVGMSVMAAAGSAVVLKKKD